MNRHPIEESSDLDEESLAAVVAKDRVDTVLASLREEGVYDDDRRIQERDDATVEIPIRASPTDTSVRAVTPAALESRRRGLASRLRRRGWGSAAIDDAPASWSVVGDIVLADFTPLSEERWPDVAGILADMHAARTVAHHEGIEGPHRVPEIEVVIGGPTLTEHVEDGTRYALDVGTVMFSPGNQAERRRMGDIVDPDEAVLDPFAGIGYFSLPMARRGAEVVAVERNPAAYEFLLDNVDRNGVCDTVGAVCGDCRAIREHDHWPGLTLSGCPLSVDPGDFDRVVMGHFDAPEYLDVAMAAVAPGGTVHLHTTLPSAPKEIPGRLRSRIQRQASLSNRSVTDIRRRQVKGYAAGIDHVVLDVEC